MPFIEPVSDENASPDVAELFGAERDRLGYVPTYLRVLADHPAAVRAWQQLNGAIKAEMDLRRYELVTLAAARTLALELLLARPWLGAHAAVSRSGRAAARGARPP